MTLLNHALRAGRTTPPSSASLATTGTALLAGGGGALGSAVLEALLGARHRGHVRVLVTRVLGTAMAGLEPMLIDDLASAPASVDALPIADTALIVFDRGRHANGRELAFLKPMPEALAALASWLHARGVRRLIVVMPHAPSQLPEALKLGLATLDEQAVAALGFEHLVFVRSAQPPTNERAAQWLQRLADGVLAQMRIMIAATQQPVRAAKVAQFVVEVAARLGASSPGTRVAPPELVWQAAQMADPAPLVQAWLDARELPALRAPKRRW